jgi:hypothetical protein
MPRKTSLSQGVPALIGWQRLHRAQVGEELAAVDELKDEVEIAGVLREALEGNDEGMRNLRVDEILIVDMIDLLCLDDLSLLEQL